MLSPRSGESSSSSGQSLASSSGDVNSIQNPLYANQKLQRALSRGALLRQPSSEDVSKSKVQPSLTRMPSDNVRPRAHTTPHHTRHAAS